MGRLQALGRVAANDREVDDDVVDAVIEGEKTEAVSNVEALDSAPCHFPAPPRPSRAGYKLTEGAARVHIGKHSVGFGKPLAG